MKAVCRSPAPWRWASDTKPASATRAKSALDARSVDDAKDLLSVVPFIWAVLTTLLLAPAWKWSGEDDRYHVCRSIAAVALSVVSAIVSAIVVAVLTPLGYKVAFRNEGDIEGFLVFYELLLLFVIGLAAVSIAVGIRALRHLHEVLATR